MIEFDASKPWIVLTPRKSGDAGADAEAEVDLVRRLGFLRARSGLIGTVEVRNGYADAPSEDSPLIVLNRNEGEGHEGYAWRAAKDRIEIYGGSRKGLADGIYDFLGALGFSWPEPGTELSPSEPAPGSTEYPFARSDAHVSVRNTGPSTKGYRRLVLDSSMGGKDGETWVQWAARNRLDAVVIPFDSDESTIDSWSERVLHRRQRVVAAARRHGLSIEEGGRCLSRLVPRRLFLRNRELFRMREGRRTPDFNFCPTNPETIDLLVEQARRRFRDRPDVEVFHLWPDLAEDGGWCSCPSCRAFSPAEQALIATNAVADALAAVRSEALLSYFPGENDSGAIKPRANLIPVEEPRKEASGTERPSVGDWIFAYRP